MYFAYENVAARAIDTLVDAKKFYLFILHKYFDLGIMEKFIIHLTTHDAWRWIVGISINVDDKCYFIRNGITIMRLKDAIKSHRYTLFFIY